MGLACPCGTFVPGALATLSRYAPLVGIQGTQDVMSRCQNREIIVLLHLYAAGLDQKDSASQGGIGLASFFL